MSAHVARIEKLTNLTRSRRNMEKVTGELDNLEELKQQLEPWLEAAEEIQSHIGQFIGRFDEIDADYLPDGAHSKAETLIRSLDHFLPGEYGSLASFVETFDEARDGLDELETMLEDRDYSADERDGKWYEVLDAVQRLAEGVAELDTMGERPTVSDDEEEEE
jgi:predicted component of type VI protein secretion system